MSCPGPLEVFLLTPAQIWHLIVTRSIGRIQDEIGPFLAACFPIQNCFEKEEEEEAWRSTFTKIDPVG